MQESRQLPGCEMTVSKPLRVITAPDQTMAADFHLMIFGEANQLVALMKVVDGSIWPQRPPLHRIFRLQHVEFVSQSGSVGTLGKLRWSYGSADKDSILICFLSQRLSAADGSDYSR